MSSQILSCKVGVKKEKQWIENKIHLTFTQSSCNVKCHSCYATCRLVPLQTACGNHVFDTPQMCQMIVNLSIE